MTESKNEAKTLSKKWVEALSTDQDPKRSELARLIFGLSSSKEKLERDLADDLGGDLTSRKGTCLTLLTSSLTHNHLRSLGDLRGMQDNMITNISKATSPRRYMPNTMVSTLVIVKQYLSLKSIYPSYPRYHALTACWLHVVLGCCKKQGDLPTS